MPLSESETVDGLNELVRFTTIGKYNLYVARKRDNFPLPTVTRTQGSLIYRWTKKAVVDWMYANRNLLYVAAALKRVAWDVDPNLFGVQD